MKKHSIQHHIDTLAVLLLFGVFAVCVLTVLLTGADAYRRMTERDNRAYDRRTCVQYVSTRLRQADAAGGVSLEVFGETKALVLRDSEDPEYVTRVYYHDGWLMELYSEEGLEMSPEDGEKVMACDWMRLNLEDGLLTIDLLDPQRQVTTLYVALRSGEGGGS